MQRSWLGVTEDDHLAYLHWRRYDPAGPLVAGTTWNRELAAVNQFYRWAVQAGHVRVHPIPQAFRRPGPREADRARRSTLDEQRPATYARDVGATPVRWLPISSYRQWRDVGVRGFDVEGLPRSSFRGRWAARNAVFCDLMIRTGLRLAEQSALLVSEVPGKSSELDFSTFWLPAAIAKGGSARTVYVPRSVGSDLTDYAECDRREVIERARAAGRYRLGEGALLIEAGRPDWARGACGRRRVRLANLSAQQRLQLLVETDAGWEPAALWLSERGLPLSPDLWKKMFATANSRCQTAGLDVTAHAHMLRHSFAVITLEQLQRGHVAALAELTPEQRGHYVRVFGDPLDWVRQRLGHRSIVTTQIYLHTLAELEMQTRQALVPDDWADPHRSAQSTTGKSAW